MSSLNIYHHIKKANPNPLSTSPLKSVKRLCALIILSTASVGLMPAFGHVETSGTAHHQHDNYDKEDKHESHDKHHSHDEHQHATQQSHTVNTAKPSLNSTIPASIRAKTDVAISNYPLFLLSEAVTKGAPSGKLLLDPGDIGHHGSLSPNDIKTVKDSRYVVWFGEALETNLTHSLAKSHNSISLFDLNAFHRAPLRDVKGNPISGTLDPHIWLDPENAKAITRALGAIYSRANPKYKEVYAKNVQQFAQKMDAAVAKVNTHPSHPRPYWAYHDAFQYIEPTLKLTMVGALTTDHHLPPKASQFHWLKQNKPQHKMCMLLQSDSNQGVLSKLQPISSTIQQEDMSHAKDFISGWVSLAQDIEKCLKSA